jgi:hypothetical protein
MRPRCDAFSRTTTRSILRLLLVPALGLFLAGPARAAEPPSAASATSPAAATVTPGDDSAATLFQRGVAALRAGAFHEAVDAFENLADHGFFHPDASFDRSLAYIGRVRAGAERPGDLGRAAAALEEALEARPNDREAEQALDIVRAEVAHRRARGGNASEVEARPTLDRALIGLASEGTWAIFAALGSLVLSAGLILRRTRRESAAHLTGAIATPLGAIILVIFAALAGGARHLRQTTQGGVIVAPEARLSDQRGVPTSSGVVIPEAALVELGDRQGSLVHVRWGAIEGWAQSSAVRSLAQP